MVQDLYTLDSAALPAWATLLLELWGSFGYLKWNELLLLEYF